VRIPLRAETSSVFAALRPLDDGGVVIDEVSVRQPTLDEVFLSLTGQEQKEKIA
jgi:hypothetical protein